VVVAQQLFTTVKRRNAIAHKAGKRLIESRWAVFFGKPPPTPSEGGGERKKPLPTSPKERRKRKNEKKNEIVITIKSKVL